MAQFLSYEQTQRNQYPMKVQEALSEMLDIGIAESISDIRRIYTLNEIFDAVLEYEGVIGLNDKIRQYIREIYGVDLDAVED